MECRSMHPWCAQRPESRNACALICANDAGRAPRKIPASGIAETRLLAFLYFIFIYIFYHIIEYYIFSIGLVFFIII